MADTTSYLRLKLCIATYGIGLGLRLEVLKPLHGSCDSSVHAYGTPANAAFASASRFLSVSSSEVALEIHC